MDIEEKEPNKANYERLSSMMLFNIRNVSHLIGRNTNKERLRAVTNSFIQFGAIPKSLQMPLNGTIVI